MNELTVAKIREVARLLQENQIPPRKVRTQAEAKELTESDLAGKKWAVGDEYYMMRSEDGETLIG